MLFSLRERLQKTDSKDMLELQVLENNLKSRKTAKVYTCWKLTTNWSRAWRFGDCGAMGKLNEEGTAVAGAAKPSVQIGRSKWMASWRFATGAGAASTFLLRFLSCLSFSSAGRSCTGFFGPITGGISFTPCPSFDGSSGGEGPSIISTIRGEGLFWGGEEGPSFITRSSAVGVGEGLLVEVCGGEGGELGVNVCMSMENLNRDVREVGG